MLPVPVARRSGETQHDHVRLEAPDDPHHVAENVVVPPLLKSFFRCLGESEIDRSRKKLLGAIDPTGRQQLLGAENAQLVALLGANQVLTALASCQREISGPQFTSAREICQ